MDIIEEKRKAEKSLFKKEGVVSVGVGRERVNGEITGDLSIVVGVSKKKKDKELSNKDIIPKKIKEYKTDVVEEGEINPLRNVPFTSETRPVKVGNSASHETVGSGTVGIPVAKPDSEKKYTLTCMHVAAPDRDTSGDFLQPAPNDGGFLSEHIMGTPTEVAPMDSSDSTNNLDAALVELDMGYILETVEGRSLKNSSRYPGTGDIGSVISKEGRTTGYTESTIDAIDVTVNIDYGGSVGACDIPHAIRVTNVDNYGTEDYFADSGDSGSVCWISESGNMIIGQVFGSSSTYVYLTEIQRALDYFNVEINNITPVAYGGLQTFTTETLQPVGQAGFLWVDGNDLHYIDQDEIDRYVVVGQTISASGTPGYVWVEGDNLCFINEYGNKSIISSVADGVSTATPGYVWVENSSLYYVGESGQVYACGWFQ